MVKTFVATNNSCLIFIMTILGATVFVAPLTQGLTTINTVYAQKEGICGPMDVAIALDDTGSMGGAIENIKTELPSIINEAKIASGDDLKLGYITFKDNVTVLNPFTTNLVSVSSNIASTFASGGNGAPEASDEAKNTAVNSLGPRPGQIGDFSTPWRADPVVKILILITDAPPGGFNDTKDPSDVQRMHDLALTAKGLNILVSDVFVPTSGDYDGQLAILKDDADTSNGVFITTAANGTGTAGAIKGIIDGCGKAPPSGVCPNENVQHWDKIVFKIQDRKLAYKVNHTIGTELDIKVLDDPTKVADIKQKVLDFLKVPEAPRKSVVILDVEYAITCAASASAVPPNKLTPELLALVKSLAEEKGPEFDKTIQLQQTNSTGNMTSNGISNSTTQVG